MSWNAIFVTSYIGKCEKALDKGENVCTIFMNLSKAFDTKNHDLLLAKLKAHGFSENASKLMCSYLKDRRQAVHINTRFFVSNTFISNARLKLAGNKQMLSNTLMLNFS